MIMINTAQQIRETIGDDCCDIYIEKWIKEIQTDFVKEDLCCVMEQVAPDGSIIDHIDGRTLNPGHAIEGAWFILHEAKYRNHHPELIGLWGVKCLIICGKEAGTNNMAESSTSVMYMANPYRNIGRI